MCWLISGLVDFYDKLLDDICNQKLFSLILMYLDNIQSLNTQLKRAHLRRTIIMNEQQQEMVSLLMGLGLRRNVARTLVALASSDETTSRRIEILADLRQPEVSTAMRYLRQQGWIEEREERKNGRGRPIKHYRLSMDLEDIIGVLEEWKREDSAQMMERIKRLQSLVSED